MKVIEDKNNNVKYILQNQLGKGSFGECYSCISKEDNIEYAIKIMSKEKLKSGLYLGLLIISSFSLKVDTFS